MDIKWKTPHDKAFNTTWNIDQLEFVLLLISSNFKTLGNPTYNLFSTTYKDSEDLRANTLLTV